MRSDPNSMGLMPAKVSGGTKTAVRSKSLFLPALSGRTCSANASSPFLLGVLCSHRAFCCSWDPSCKPQLRRWEDLGLGCSLRFVHLLLFCPTWEGKKGCSGKRARAAALGASGCRLARREGCVPIRRGHASYKNQGRCLPGDPGAAR